MSMTRDEQLAHNARAKFLRILLVVFCVVVFLFGCLFFFPIWAVWQQGLEGEAALKKAKQTRQIIVEQALAEKDAATHTAAAINIVGQAAKDFPEYRAQEFIRVFGEALTNGSIQKIIYVPTEANVPIVDQRHATSKFSD